MSRRIEVELFAAISMENPLGGTIVVATDGIHGSDGAVRVGNELSRRDRVNAALVSVVEPLTFFDEHEGSSPADAERRTRLAIEAREGALTAQYQRTYPRQRGWPFAIHVGDRVDEIVRFAQDHDASLIVMGLGSHSLISRLLHHETALRVARTATTPILAVPADARGLPHSALVAIDFSPSSEEAARATLKLLGGEGTLYLAHVSPRIVIPQGDSRPWGEPATSDALEQLRALARRLGAPDTVHIEFVSLHGEPAQELLTFAEENAIDMIATGAHGRSLVGRLVLGSVSTKIIRSARSWVLVAPPQRVDARTSAPPFVPDAQPIG